MVEQKFEEVAKRVGDQIIQSFKQGDEIVHVEVSAEGIRERVLNILLAQYLAEVGATFKLEDLEIKVDFTRVDDHEQIPATIKMKPKI